MRKIDIEMLAAVNEKRNWGCSNTAVVVDNNVVQVILHGSIIYERRGAEVAFTLAGWNTTTTRSRLRALGVDVCGRVGVDNRATYNGKEIDNNKWYNV